MNDATTMIAYFLAILMVSFIAISPIVLLILFIIWLCKRKKTKATKQPQKSYATGWKWNEQTQLWEPPEEQKIPITKPTYQTVYNATPNKDTITEQPDENGTYRLKYKTATPKVAQDNIPHNDWKTMNPSEKQFQSSPVENSVDRYVFPTTEKIKGYKSKYLLTKHEWNEHKKLREYAAQKGLRVCPKVRMLDLVTPYGNGGEYMTRFHKVQAKHVDFVLVDEGMHIRAIVELDDASHDEKERQERDQFVDEVLSGVGYTVIHTRCITEKTLSRL